MVFTKINTKRRNVEIAEQMIQTLENGAFCKGDKFPSERDIATQMGVSRTAVREALIALQIAGILETMPGKGTFVVKDPDEVSNSTDIISSMKESDSPFEALEMRTVLEIGLVQIAVEKITQRIQNKITKELEILKRATEECDFDKGHRADYSIHLLIAESTQNSLAPLTLKPLLDVLRQSFSERLRNLFYHKEREDYAAAHYRVHEEIVIALESKNAIKAKEAMEKHFELVVDSLRIFKS